jgi:hypothetical protein
VELLKEKFANLWSNATQADCTEDDYQFSAGVGNTSYAIAIDIQEQIASQDLSKQAFSIQSNKDVELMMSLLDTRGNESIRMNLMPFLKGSEYVVPCTLFIAPNTQYKQILFHATGNLQLKSISLNFIPDYVLKLKIMLSSGIGDCLRALSRNQSLGRCFQTIPTEIYWSYAGNNLHDSGWGPLLQSDVLGKNAHFHFIDHATFDQLFIPEMFNGYTGKFLFSNHFPDEYQGFNLSLTPEELEVVSTILNNSNKKIGIQLQGNDPKKNLGTTKTIAIFKHILSQFPESNIYIIDAPNRKVDSTLLFDDRIINLVGKTGIAQNIHLIQAMDLWISPDSFSKYVANWSNVQQIILCCQLPYIDPKNMLINAFQVVGLLNNENASLVGVTFDESLENITIKNDISEIDVTEIIKLI